MALTPRQRQVFEQIKTGIKENGYAPTYQEVGDAMGGLSKTSVYEHVECLIEKGFLARGSPNQARNLRIVGETKVVLEEAVEAVVDVLEKHPAAEPEALLDLVSGALNSLKRY